MVLFCLLRSTSRRTWIYSLTWSWEQSVLTATSNLQKTGIWLCFTHSKGMHGSKNSKEREQKEGNDPCWHWATTTRLTNGKTTRVTQCRLWQTINRTALLMGGTVNQPQYKTDSPWQTNKYTIFLSHTPWPIPKFFCICNLKPDSRDRQYHIETLWLENEISQSKTKKLI